MEEQEAAEAGISPRQCCRVEGSAGEGLEEEGEVALDSL